MAMTGPPLSVTMICPHFKPMDPSVLCCFYYDALHSASPCLQLTNGHRLHLADSVGRVCVSRCRAVLHSSRGEPFHMTGEGQGTNRAVGEKGHGNQPIDEI